MEYEYEYRGTGECINYTSRQEILSKYQNTDTVIYDVLIKQRNLICGSAPARAQVSEFQRQLIFTKNMAHAVNCFNHDRLYHHEVFSRLYSDDYYSGFLRFQTDDNGAIVKNYVGGYVLRDTSANLYQRNQNLYLSRYQVGLGEVFFHWALDGGYGTQELVAYKKDGIIYGILHPDHFYTQMDENNEVITPMIYPNPADKIIRIEKDDTNKIRALRLYSLNGTLIKEQLNTSQLPVHNVPPAIYLLKVEQDTRVLTQRVYIQH